MRFTNPLSNKFNTLCAEKKHTTLGDMRDIHPEVDSFIWY